MRVLRTFILLDQCAPILSCNVVGWCSQLWSLDFYHTLQHLPGHRVGYMNDQVTDNYLDIGYRNEHRPKHRIAYLYEQLHVPGHKIPV